MPDDLPAIAKDLLNARFIEEMPRLKRRLIFRTGSRDIAEDLLHDVWVRFSGHSTCAVRNPAAYLSRIADNLATDNARYRSRRLSAKEVDDLLDVPDDRPTTERILIGREQVQNLVDAMDDLPERQRSIFIAARLRGERYELIARRHSITVRTVENEVRRALDFFSARLEDRAI